MEDIWIKLNVFPHLNAPAIDCKLTETIEELYSIVINLEVSNTNLQRRVKELEKQNIEKLLEKRISNKN